MDPGKADISATLYASKEFTATAQYPSTMKMYVSEWDTAKKYFFVPVLWEGTKGAVDQVSISADTAVSVEMMATIGGTYNMTLRQRVASKPAAPALGVDGVTGKIYRIKGDDDYVQVPGLVLHDKDQVDVMPDGIGCRLYSWAFFATDSSNAEEKGGKYSIPFSSKDPVVIRATKDQVVYLEVYVATGLEVEVSVTYAKPLATSSTGIMPANTAGEYGSTFGFLSSSIKLPMILRLAH